MSHLKTVSRKRSQAGFNLVELAIVMMTIALLAIIAIPNFLKARTGAWQSLCIQNLNKTVTKPTIVVLRLRHGYPRFAHTYSAALWTHSRRTPQNSLRTPGVPDPTTLCFV